MNDLAQNLLHVQVGVRSVVGIALAVCVTGHILLRKREVASAAGWIGLVWFAPLFGTVSYLVLGVNRVRRRARRLRPQDDDDGAPLRQDLPGHDDELGALRRGIGHISGRPLLGGTRIEAFENGDAAYPPMLAAIAAAQDSVAMSSYIFRDDLWGGRFIDALAEAHARGVAVRVLIDGVGGGWIRSAAYHRLRRRGVPAARFLHSVLPWRMPFFNLRSHKKILVIDGRIGFTGGMNISDQNVMATKPEAPVQDLHFRIDGPVVRQLAQAFAEDWAFITDEEVDEAEASPEVAPRPGALARIIDSGPDEDLEKVEFAVLQAVACARHRIAVMTPYFLPDERLNTALALAAMRGVAVDLVIPEKSDHALVDWAAQANIGPLLSDGVRIWRSPPPFHHTKLMVVDADWCLIGSCNWDIRSFRLNFELCMELYDQDLAEQLVGVMHVAQGRSLSQQDLASRTLPIRLRDAAARLLLPYL